MPITPWEDITGESCQKCGGPATHYYINIPLCCDCHGGKVVTKKEAEFEQALDGSDRWLFLYFPAHKNYKVYATSCIQDHTTPVQEQDTTRELKEGEVAAVFIEGKDKEKIISVIRGLIDSLLDTLALKEKVVGKEGK